MPPFAIVNVLSNTPIGTTAPANWVEPSKVYPFVLQMVSDNHGRPTFEFSERPMPGGGTGGTPPEPNPHAGSKSKHLDIKIAEDAIIDIRLHKPIFWHWAPENAVTTGKDMKDYYFLLEYFVNGTWIPDPQGSICERIRFRAKMDGNNHDTPFNLNVHVVYDNNEILPISIDPDIRNPGTLP
jgi:hypothetical protein